MKSFRGDLLLLYRKLKAGIPFAFNRFSDGEEFILQNKKLEITNTRVVAGDQVWEKGFSKEDHKLWDPNEHQWFREALWKAFFYDAPNYFKGIPCKCCVGKERNKWFLEMLPYKSNVTWANLLVNGNYSFFIDTFVPLFSNKDIIIICNEKADISGLPFEVKKDFRVGDNCMIKNYPIIEEIKEFTTKSSSDLIYLFSASALSKVAIHQLFLYNNRNTYIDIGTTLNKYLGMSLDRDYLKNKWCGTNYEMGNRICIW